MTWRFNESETYPATPTGSKSPDPTESLTNSQSPTQTASLSRSPNATISISVSASESQSVSEYPTPTQSKSQVVSETEQISSSSLLFEESFENSSICSLIISQDETGIVQKETDLSLSDEFTKTENEERALDESVRSSVSDEFHISLGTQSELISTTISVDAMELIVSRVKFSVIWVFCIGVLGLTGFFFLGWSVYSEKRLFELREGTTNTA
jgi:hypothetical protein